MATKIIQPRRITDAGLALIKQFETFSPTVYICPAGKPTIGYGHVVLVHERSKFVHGISMKDACTLLLQDAAIAESAVLRLISTPLTDSQFDALVSFTFNLGEGALEHSDLRTCVNRRDWPGAVRELRRWVHGNGKVLPGLVVRRNKEAALLVPSPSSQKVIATPQK